MNALDGDVLQIFQTEKSFGIILDDGIQFYNISKREFDKKIEIPRLRMITFKVKNNSDTAVFDAAQNLLYYHPEKSSTWSVIDIKTKQSTKICNSTGTSNEKAHGIIISNEFHLFGGKLSIHHSYDPHSKHYKNIEDINVPFIFNTNYFASQLFIKSSDKLKVYLFDDQITGSNGEVMMLKYSIASKKWDKTSISLPEAIRPFGAVSVKNDKFILVITEKI